MSNWRSICIHNIIDFVQPSGRYIFPDKLKTYIYKSREAYMTSLVFMKSSSSAKPYRWSMPLEAIVTDTCHSPQACSAYIRLYQSSMSSSAYSIAQKPRPVPIAQLPKKAGVRSPGNPPFTFSSASSFIRAAFFMVHSFFMAMSSDKPRVLGSCTVLLSYMYTREPAGRKAAEKTVVFDRSIKNTSAVIKSINAAADVMPPRAPRRLSLFPHPRTSSEAGSLRYG